MEYQMLVLYTKTNAKDAEETFEDIQSELSAFKISFEKQKGKKLKIGNASISFLPFDEKVKKQYDSIYTSLDLKKPHDTYLKSRSKKLTYHARPFQNLVDIVLEIKEKQQ